MKRGPILLLIWGISVKDKKKILEQQCFTTKLLAFITYPFAVVSPDYICLLRKLTVQDKEDLKCITTSIKKAWRAEKSPVLKAVTDTYSKAKEGEVDPNVPRQAFTAIDDLEMHTLEALVDEKTEHLVNIYMPIASSEDKHWEAIQKAAELIKYKTALNRHGIIFNKFICFGCHGIDHPTAQCHYKEVEEWIVSDPPNKATKDNTTPQKGKDRDARSAKRGTSTRPAAQRGHTN